MLISTPPPPKSNFYQYLCIFACEFLSMQVCFLHRDWVSGNEEMDTADQIIIFCFLLQGL